MFDQIAYKRQWRKDNPDRLKQQNLMAKYNITIVEFFRMLKRQKGLCAICHKPETAVNWRTGKVRLLSVDHNHRTNKIRKLLCRRCNMAIGLFKESVKLLQSALTYLSEEKR